ncbi:MAG: SURF1 family protein [Hyphomonadaceae bacterium]|jgi:surfeit locus 1 family protein|nr:SURF1 family protein [Hyphomonadaceae bacterium]
MLSTLRHAKLLWPTLAALVALGVLLGLGTWQLERKRWKDDLLATIAARATAAPLPVARAAEIASRGGNIEYMHVSATGRFHHDKERFLYAPAPSGLAWHVYTPLEITPGLVVWVNRGTVPDASKAPVVRTAGQIAGETEVRGLVRRPPEKAQFTPQNDAAGNLWYWADIPALTTSAFVPDSVVALPFALEADAEPSPPGGLPKGGVTRIALPNRHLEYAVTWYGLALTLIGVYLAFAANRLRGSPPE